MTELYPGLWVGDIKTSQNRSFLINNNITCIINCTNKVSFLSLPQISKKFRIPVSDNLDPTEIYKLYANLDKAATLIYRMLPKHNILVHCYSGAQRSVTVAVAFFMKYTELTWQEIYAAIKTKRAKLIDLNFEQAVIHYEYDLLKARQYQEKCCD